MSLDLFCIFIHLLSREIIAFFYQRADNISQIISVVPSQGFPIAFKLGLLPVLFCASRMIKENFRFLILKNGRSYWKWLMITLGFIPFGNPALPPVQPGRLTGIQNEAFNYITILYGNACAIICRFWKQSKLLAN